MSNIVDVYNYILLTGRKKTWQYTFFCQFANLLYRYPRPLALVVTTGKVSDTIKQDLVKAVRTDLGAIACLDKVVLVARLPKTRSGKVLRRCIRDMAAGNPVNVPATIEDATVLTDIEAALQKEGLIPQTKSKL